jgi:hypothetical protein
MAPNGRPTREPSVDGLAYSLARYVSRDPERARPLIEVAATLHEPSYVRGIIGGLASAAEQGRPIPWPEALRLARHVAEQRDSDLPAERQPQADRGWGEAKQNLLALLDTQAVEHFSDDEVAAAWDLIDVVLQHPDTDEPPDSQATVRRTARVWWTTSWLKVAARSRSWPRAPPFEWR